MGAQRASIPGAILGGVGAAIRARLGVFAGVALAVLALDVFLPIVVLSLARTPVDYFMFNPWLKKLPGYLVSPAVPWQKKLEFLPKLALFWFSGEGAFGPEWGFAVDVSDVARFLVTAFLVGAYFALWFCRRDQVAGRGWRIRLGRHGGMAGALTSVVGLSTGPCSVIGCGAPVVPVVGLAFVGLSSGTLAFLAHLSTVASWTVIGAMALGVGYLGWLVRARGVAAPSTARRAGDPAPAES